MKTLQDLTVRSVEHPHARYVLLRLAADTPLPDIHPGQFAQIRVDGSPTTFLRRPISIHFVDREHGEIWLLVQTVGAGTQALARLTAGDRLNVLFPLGHGFSPAGADERLLLVGGGVGVAPLLEYGKTLREAGARPTFLLGARSKDDLLQLEHFGRYGEVCLTTEDGTAGERGFVTGHSVWDTQQFDHIAVCGPKPMMVAVARIARQRHIPCEVSLENMMACGLGACLCCVEHTVRGNVCVCKEGPVFDINDLTWQL